MPLLEVLRPPMPRGDEIGPDAVEPDVAMVPGMPSIVPVLRRVVRASFAGFQRCEAAELIVSEFATYAVLDLCDCCRPGTIKTAVFRHPTRVRLEVEYECTPAHEPRWDEEATESYSRGLTIVRALSDRWGHDRWGEGRYQSHQRWWSELSWRP